VQSNWLRLCAVAIILLVFDGVLPKGVAGKREHFDLVSTTRFFLDAYARADRQKVLSMIDPAVTAYGSDLDEVFKGKGGVEKMLRDDAQLWNGAATIGEMQQISTFQDGDVASIFFNAPFRLGKQEPVAVRFAIVWHRSAKGWRVVQSSSVVPTRGQSAEELLGGRH